MSEILMKLSERLRDNVQYLSCRQTTPVHLVARSHVRYDLYNNEG